MAAKSGGRGAKASGGEGGDGLAWTRSQRKKLRGPLHPHPLDPKDRTTNLRYPWLASRILVLGLGASSAGCGPGPDPQTTFSTSSTSSTGGGMQCNAPEDCPLPAGECVTRTCVDRTCGTEDVAAGTKTSAQTPGDCKQDECDGKGAVVSMNDDTDLPFDNATCTQDLCTNGVPSNPAVIEGPVCSEDTTPETCQEVKQAMPGATDGDYTLYVGGDVAKPWTAFCQDMASTPIEYLPLVNTMNANFSQYTAGGASPGTDVRTAFVKVRIDPVTLAVDANDQTYVTSTGMLLHSGSGSVTSMPYGVAADCVAAGSATGVGNIDLTGTPFAVVGAQFSLGGALPGGSTTYGASNRTVDLTGGGFCGWNGVTGSNNPFNQMGKPLQLVYAP